MKKSVRRLLWRNDVQGAMECEAETVEELIKIMEKTKIEMQ